jgi:hypothetical protein
MDEYEVLRFPFAVWMAVVGGILAYAAFIHCGT